MNYVRKLSVLVVDDDRQICAFLEELLSLDGFEVGLAYGYSDAVDAMMERRYDHVLVDFLYPRDPDRRDGVDVLQAARQISPETLVYLMTLLGGNVFIEPIAANGFDGVLAKPFSVTTVRSLLGVGTVS